MLRTLVGLFMGVTMLSVPNLARGQVYPVFVYTSALDGASELLAFQTKEKISASPLFNAVPDLTAQHFGVYIGAIDYPDGPSGKPMSIYSVDISFRPRFPQDINLEVHVDSTQGYCGWNRVPDCADYLTATIYGAINRWALSDEGGLMGVARLWAALDSGSENSR
jgi:hypothetical protein